jgi:hypothetical protein
MVVLLRAWRSALIPDVLSLRQFAEEARVRMPTTVDTYRVLIHSFQLVGDTVAARQAEKQLRDILPEYWQERDGRARLLWKENPWLQEFAED